MRSDVNVGTWAKVNDRCPMEYRVNGDDEVELLMGHRADSFEVIFTPEALERFLELGTQALAEAKKQAAEALPV